MLRSVQDGFLIQNIIKYPIAFQTFHLKACPKSGNLSLVFHFTLHVKMLTNMSIYFSIVLVQVVSYMSLVRVTFHIPFPIFPR